MGMSQEKLGEAVGITFQQVQKYERGTNRISASRLYSMSRVLDVPVSFFFDDMPDDVANEAPSQTENKAPAALDNDPMTKRETLDLIRTYFSIDDPDLRKQVYDLARTLAKVSRGGDVEEISEEAS
mgnify:CR=1 FL=1